MNEWILRKRVVSDIVNVVFVEKLLIDNPWCIRNHFIHPSAHRQTLFHLHFQHYLDTVVLRWLIRIFPLKKWEWKVRIYGIIYILAVAEGLVTFILGHDGFAFVLVCHRVAAASNQKVRVRKSATPKTPYQLLIINCYIH